MYKYSSMDTQPFFTLQKLLREPSMTHCHLLAALKQNSICFSLHYVLIVCWNSSKSQTNLYGEGAAISAVPLCCCSCPQLRLLQYPHLPEQWALGCTRFPPWFPGKILSIQCETCVKPGILSSPVCTVHFQQSK